MAPDARAFSAVRSVELLSQTMISLSQPVAAKASVAALILRSERAMNFSSLNAGTTTEIFMMRSLTDDRPKVKDQSKGKTSRRIHVLVNTRADSGRDRMLRSLNRCNPRPAFARGATLRHLRFTMFRVGFQSAPRVRTRGDTRQRRRRWQRRSFNP